MIWFKFQTHEYMDESPCIGFQLFDNAETAMKWAKDMNATYSGGTITILGPANQEEVLKFVKDNDLKLNVELASKIKDPHNYLKN